MEKQKARVLEKRHQGSVRGYQGSVRGGAELHFRWGWVGGWVGWVIGSKGKVWGGGGGCPHPTPIRSGGVEFWFKPKMLKKHSAKLDVTKDEAQKVWHGLRHLRKLCPITFQGSGGYNW